MAQNGEITSEIEVNIQHNDAWGFFTKTDILLPKYSLINGLTIFKINPLSYNLILEVYLIEPKLLKNNTVVILNRGENANHTKLNLTKLLVITGSLLPMDMLF